MKRVQIRLAINDCYIGPSGAAHHQTASVFQKRKGRAGSRCSEQVMRSSIGAAIVREGSWVLGSASVLLNSEPASKQIIAHRNAHQYRGPDDAECRQLTYLTVFPQLVNGDRNHRRLWAYQKNRHRELFG